MTKLRPLGPAQALTLAGALGLSACGDGMPLQLGTTAAFEPFDDSGIGGKDGGSPPPDDAGSSQCTNGERVTSALSDLLREVVGFGSDAGGGRDGCLYRVTNANDSGPGSLRAGLEQPGALWIVFERDVEITLASNIKPLSHKTVDGRGRRVTLRRYGLEITAQEHFVIANVAFDGENNEAPEIDGDARDAISMQKGSHDVWIDHCTFQSYEDGLIDVIEGSTDVTVSWSYFVEQQQPQQVMLFGARATDTMDRELRVTIHHNRFDRTERYHPRLRFGRVHAFNNLLDGWGDEGIRVSQQGQLYSEFNIYYAADGNGKDTITTVKLEGGDTEFGRARWNEAEDWFANGAVVGFDGKGNTTMNDPTVLPPTYSYAPDRPADNALQRDLVLEAGVGLPP